MYVWKVAHMQIISILDAVMSVLYISVSVQTYSKKNHTLRKNTMMEITLV